MKRIPEEELMDSAEQARAYADADYSGPHDAFISYFKTSFPEFRKGLILLSVLQKHFRKQPLRDWMAQMICSLLELMMSIIGACPNR